MRETAYILANRTIKTYLLQTLGMTLLFLAEIFYKCAVFISELTEIYVEIYEFDCV